VTGTAGLRVATRGAVLGINSQTHFFSDICVTARMHNCTAGRYLSEHVLTADLKVAMRDVIRANRAKHARHKDVANLAVIERCTNMWWNPINARDLQVRSTFH
jgi:hypothetical protein